MRSHVSTPERRCIGGPEQKCITAGYRPEVSFPVRLVNVERGDRGEVKTVEAFHGREARLFDARLDHPPFPLDQFEFGQAQQVAGMIEARMGKRGKREFVRVLRLLDVFRPEGRSVANSSGSFQPTNGATRSSAPILCSSNAR